MSHVDPSSVVIHESGHRIADRYRVESLLGQGGMAAVYAVSDESTGKSLALKRLLPHAKPKHKLLFEREYHVLASLSHPHIVRAFDFGSDAAGPFYTMELLRGTDLEALAPCPWSRACAILAQVTSALSVLHARRLLHRDVSARNVWLTEEGTIKLIDFGALTPFGPAADIAGTPPFLAPEALRTQQLDQRSDLYSIGALGYFLLTRRHAYPARQLSELEHHWACKPEPPSARVQASDIPASLDALTESLLSTDPNSRPRSAAELLDRLHAIAPLADASALQAIEGCLGSKVFVGRSRDKRKVRVAVTHALDGLGANFCVEGAPLAGRSRFLAEVAIEARLAGSIVIETSAQIGRDSHGAAIVCASKLLDAVPALARKTVAPHARVIGHLSEALRDKLELKAADLEPMPPVPGEARLRIQAALSQWFLDLSRERAVTLIVDDLDALDEPSAAFVAALARAGKSGRLVILASVQADSVRGEAVAAFVQAAHRVRLECLSYEEVRELLQSVFGETEHLARLAERVARATQGNPGQVMALAQFLVREGIARYVEGTWVLPPDIAEIALPNSSDDVHRAELARLGSDARLLGQAISAVDGVISLDVCAAIGDIAGARLFSAVEGLVTEGVLSKSGEGYEFAHEAQRQTLRAELGDERSRRVHRLIADWLLRRQDLTHRERLQAGVHLLRAREHEQGARVVGRAAIDFVLERPEERRPAIAYLEEALLLLRAHGASDHQLVGVLSALGANSYMVDRRLADDYGDEALERLERVLCLDTARRLRRFLGGKLSLYLALIKAGLRLRRFRHDPLVPTMKEAMGLLMSCAASLAGTFTLCIDPRRVLRSAHALEPFAVLGIDHVAGFFHAYCAAFAATVQDRFAEANQRLAQLVQRLSDPRPIAGMPDTSRKYCLAGALYAYGVTECWRDRSKALAIADRIAQQPIKLYQVSADQIRTLYYAQQGDQQRSNEHRQRVELHALQRGVTWQIDVWAPGGAISACTRTHDALRLKQAIEQLRHLSKSTPSLTQPMRRARGAYLVLQERYEEALVVFEEERRNGDRSVVGWARMLAGLARVYRELGQPERARETCLEASRCLTPADLDFVAQTQAVPI
ncbi:MAG TPA: protein kinase, partial [Polyangiales bacterium]